MPRGRAESGISSNAWVWEIFLLAIYLFEIDMLSSRSLWKAAEIKGVL